MRSDNAIEQWKNIPNFRKSHSVHVINDLVLWICLWCCAGRGGLAPRNTNFVRLGQDKPYTFESNWNQIKKRPHSRAWVMISNLHLSYRIQIVQIHYFDMIFFAFISIKLSLFVIAVLHFLCLWLSGYTTRFFFFLSPTNLFRDWTDFTRVWCRSKFNWIDWAN